MIGTGSTHRSVLTQAVIPPPGYSLDAGVVCTYSLSLPTLLTLPAHVVLGDDSSRHELLENPVALLDALRRASDRLDIFVHAGAMHAPHRQHLLYGLLEPMIHEVFLAESTGFAASKSFHPKLWALRFVPLDSVAPVRMRLLVLSRNLTEDRSWDLSLSVDGIERGRARAQNNDLRALLRLLATVPGDTTRQERIRSVADSVGRTEWEVPPPFEALSFVVLGLKRGGWLPRFEEGSSKSLVVVSPFVDTGSLRALADTTRDATALISTPAELDRLGPDGLAGFRSVKVLSDQAEAEDGEALDPSLGQLRGLHAKLYLYQRGYRVRVAVGSANATPRALLNHSNVEVLAVLEGSLANCGEPAQLLSDEHGLGEVLTDWRPPDQPVETDSVANQALDALDALRERMAQQADLSLRCDPRDSGGWTLQLQVAAPVALHDGASVSCWPVTVAADHAVDARPLATAEPVSMFVASTALLTGLVAFELTHPDAPHAVRFVLNLEVEGMPDDRQACVMEAVLQSPQGFLRYLRYLLGELQSDDVVDPGDGAGVTAWSHVLGLGDDAVLEALTRTLARHPGRLVAVRDLVDHLQKSDEGRSMLPADFMKVWRAFEPHLSPRAPAIGAAS